MAGTLLMPGENNLDILLLMQHIENLEHDPAGERKDRLDAFALEAFDKDLSACEFHPEPPHQIRRLPADGDTEDIQGIQ